MAEMQNIQWFPGHMTRTRRQIQASIKLIDAVVEIVDARVPQSSRNPDLPKLIGDKPRLMLLNKCDMADASANAAWVRRFADEGVKALPVDCKSGAGLNAFLPAVRTLLSERTERLKAKGMAGRPLRIMIAGIPNVGKSSFINRMARGSKAKVEDRPGVTRGNQWFSIPGGIDMLDTPGVLWPKFDDQSVGEKLAFIGSIRDNVLDTESLACRLLDYLIPQYLNLIEERYKLSGACGDSYELLREIGRRRGMLVSGGEVDTERAAIMLLDEFRAAKIGRISLEKPNE